MPVVVGVVLDRGIEQPHATFVQIETPAEGSAQPKLRRADTVAVAGFPLGARVEIELVAATPP